MPTLIPQASGTIINSTSPATTRASASFDGTFPQADAFSTNWPSSGTAYIGKDWGSGVTNTVVQVLIKATSDADFYAGGGGSGGAQIGVDESSDGSSWTNIYTGSLNPGYSNSQVVTANTTSPTAKRYHRVTFASNGANNRRCAEVEFYSPTAYTLTASVAAFVLTGIAASLTKGRTIVADVAAFTLTANAAGLISARKLVAAVSTFTLTGIAAALKYGRVLAAARALFVLTANSANLIHGFILNAGRATFVFTANAALLVRGRVTLYINRRQSAFRLQLRRIKQFMLGD